MTKTTQQNIANNEVTYQNEGLGMGNYVRAMDELLARSEQSSAFDGLEHPAAPREDSDKNRVLEELFFGYRLTTAQRVLFYLQTKASKLTRVLYWQSLRIFRNRSYKKHLRDIEKLEEIYGEKIGDSIYA